MYKGPWDRCEAAYGYNKENRCVLCGEPLKGRQQIWCSEWCSRTFWNNHSFQAARAARLIIDKRQCVRCGMGQNPRPTRRIRGILVSVRGRGLEVNHIEPVMGKHQKHGCWHHLDGLQTLCVSCHREETKRQREAGLFKRADE